MSNAADRSPRRDPEESTVTVRDSVLRLLRSFGLTRIFGNPGSTELPLLLDLPDDFEYVLGLQESVVVAMADGYAQAARSAAFVNLHSAAGVGHAMGSIFTAFKNRTPLLITAGQQARAMLPLDPFLHSREAAELPKPYVKWSCEPARAEDVPLAIARAYYIAMQEPRGPVLVSVPVDDWDKPGDLVEPRMVSSQSRAEPASIRRVAAALNASERPAFVVGPAIDRGGAWDEVVALAERHQARVFGAALAGRGGFPENHPLFAGFLASRRQATAKSLAGHDVVLAIGAPAFTYNVEQPGPQLEPGTRLYQLIEDPDTASWTQDATSVVASIRLGILDLLAQAAPRPRSAPALRPPPPPAAAPAAGARMSVAFALQTLAELRCERGVIVEEAPTSKAQVQAYLPNSRPGTFYAMCSGGLGFGLPAAVGVALARPGTKVIAVLGDGSSMYAIQGLWSAAQMKLPITFLILKNRRYAALQQLAALFGHRQGDVVAGTELPDISFVPLAEGQGCAGLHVGDASDLHGALEAALKSPRPTLVEVEVA